MSLYTLIIVTFVIFMAINVIIGLRGRKHASTTKDFLTASGQSGIWFIIASAVGASIGSGVVIGTTQYAVKLGVAGAWYAIACGLACVVHAFVMTRFIYRNKLVSFSDYFKRRYDSNFIILLYSGIGPFACAASMGGQLVAAKAIFQAFGIDPTIGLVITAAVMLVYTMFAGLWGSYATAVFQVGVIIVGVLVVGISMFTQGGVAEIHAFYPAENFDLFNISPELWMMFVGPMVLSVLVDQTSVQRAASAKTEATAFWGHLLSCIPLFLFGWLMVYIGMWSGAEFPDAGGNAFIVMLMNKVSPIVCAVMICAILAAIMSTASGALVATDALVVHDLYCGFINKNATEEQQKRLNLIVNIVVSVAAVVCALAFTNVIDLLSVGYTIMLSGTLVPLLGGIIWKRGTTKGAAASAAVGMITALLSIFGVITLDHPPLNSVSKRMMVEMMRALDEFEQNDVVRAIMVKANGPDFSYGADGGDVKKGVNGEAEEISESFSVLGNRLVERIDGCPKPTLVAAKGRCIGGSTAMFNAFDIRIVGEGFRMHDGDIYYGTVGSWGMSSLRLPMWIGRNKVLDYMFLNEDFTGRQCYELGLASKVVADELVEVVGLATAKKMSKAAPIAVKYYKDCVRKATQNNIEEARAFELKAAEIVFATEDSKIGLKSVVENHGVPNCEFYGR